MAIFIRNRTELEQQLVMMKTQKGTPIRALARQFAISRNMVRRILRKHEAYRDEGHDILQPEHRAGSAKRGSKLDPFEKRIKLLLEKYPKITGERLFEELGSAGYDGGISILRDRLRSLRPGPKQTPIVRFETDPGIQGQMDWSPYRIKFLRTGPAEVQCFSYILGFSRRQFIDFTPRRDFFTLIRRHQDAFTYFGGVPSQCLYDSEKTVVLRWEAGRPLLNPAFSAFITHYHCRPIICQRARPETKGKEIYCVVVSLRIWKICVPAPGGGLKRKATGTAMTPPVGRRWNFFWNRSRPHSNSCHCIPTTARRWRCGSATWMVISTSRPTAILSLTTM
jgi:transposase